MIQVGLNIEIKNMTNNNWEKQLKSYMVELIDEYFPKDNQKHPELPSTTHRSETMASHSLFFIKFKEILSSQKQKMRDTPMGVSQWREYGKKFGYWEFFTKELKEELLSKLPKEKTGNILVSLPYAVAFDKALSEVVKIIKEL